MEEQTRQEILQKIEQLIDLPECKNKNYQRDTISSELRKKILDKQGGICFLCKTDTRVPLTHHIIPDEESTEGNLVMLCFTCHSFIHGIVHRFLGYKNVIRGGFGRGWGV